MWLFIYSLSCSFIFINSFLFTWISLAKRPLFQHTKWNKLTVLFCIALVWHVLKLIPLSQLFDSFWTPKVSWHSFPNHISQTVNLKNMHFHLNYMQLVCIYLFLGSGNKRRKPNLPHCLPQKSFQFNVFAWCLLRTCYFFHQYNQSNIVQVVHFQVLILSPIVRRAFWASVLISSFSANELHSSTCQTMLEEGYVRADWSASNKSLHRH